MSEYSGAQVKYFALGTFILAIFVCLGLTQVWQHTASINMRYRISALQKEKRAMLEENHMLRIQAAQLKSFPRIKSIAEESLGFSYPDKNNILYINTGAGAQVIKDEGGKSKNPMKNLPDTIKKLREFKNRILRFVLFDANMEL